MATTQKSGGPRRRSKGGTADRSGHVQSLQRALAILEAVSQADDGITLTDVSHQVGLPPSTAHRLLTTLQQEHFVRFDSERTVWHVGVQAFVVGNAFVRSRNLVELARPYMRRLMEESGETVNLAVEDQGEAIFLSQVECRQMMRALVTPGHRVAMHCSGVGKALMSGMADVDLARVLQSHGLTKMTERTIIRPQDLRDELDRVRECGYAIDDEEHALGLRCVAAVIRNEHGHVIAGLSISGPAARIPKERIPVLGDVVRRTGDSITREFGGRTATASAA